MAVASGPSLLVGEVVAIASVLPESRRKKRRKRRRREKEEDEESCERNWHKKSLASLLASLPEVRDQAWGTSGVGCRDV